MNATVKKWLTMVWATVMWTVSVTGIHAQSVNELLAKAEGLFRQGLTEEARQVHEKIVQLDTACLESNVWLGNYYFLKGEEKRKQAEDAYRSLPDPSRMQSAFYQEQLKSICQDFHIEADTLLQRANRRQPSEYLLTTLAQIETFKIRVGLAKPPVKKKTAALKLFRLTPGNSVLP